MESVLSARKIYLCQITGWINKIKLQRKRKNEYYFKLETLHFSSNLSKNTYTCKVQFAARNNKNGRIVEHEREASESNIRNEKQKERDISKDDMILEKRR